MSTKDKAPRFAVGDFVMLIAWDGTLLGVREVATATAQSVSLGGAHYRHNGKAVKRGHRNHTIRLATEEESAKNAHDRRKRNCLYAVERGGALDKLTPDALRIVADVLGVK